MNSQHLGAWIRDILRDVDSPQSILTRVQVWTFWYGVTLTLWKLHNERKYLILMQWCLNNIYEENENDR